MTDVNNEMSTPEAHAATEEVARQTKAVTDPLTNQLKGSCDFMKDLHWGILRRNEEANNTAQGSLRASGSRFD